MNQREVSKALTLMASHHRVECPERVEGRRWHRRRV